MLRPTARTFGLLMALTGALQLALHRPQRASLPAEQFWLQKTFPGERFDGVMAGDSRLYRGFNPSTIEAQLGGRRLHNFGYSSARLTPAYLDAAKAHLKTQRPGSLIVLAVTAHSLSAPKTGADNPHYDGFAGRHPINVWIQLQSGLIRNVLWRAALDDPTEALLLARQGESRVHYHQRFDHRGFVASSTTPRSPSRALPGYRKTLRASPVSPQRLDALAEWVRTTTRQGVRVVALVPPRPPAMAAIERAIGGWSEEAVRRRLVASGAQWVDLSWEGLSSYDGSHLDERSAELASQRLAKKLAVLLERIR